MSQDQNPLIKNLKFSSPESLDTYLPAQRTDCPRCKRHIRYYCATCLIPNAAIERHLPCVNLPFAVEILKHFRESDSKSTAVHAKLLSPDVTITTYDPRDQAASSRLQQQEGTFLLYPGSDAIDISGAEPPLSISRLIIIDGTWRQSKSMARTLSGIPKVTFPASSSFFWRYQNFGSHCVSTIEALYHFCRAFGDRFSGPPAENPNYDDLLFLFSHFYKIIQHRYREDTSLSFTKRHRSAYIDYRN